MLPGEDSDTLIAALKQLGAEPVSLSVDEGQVHWDTEFILLQDFAADFAAYAAARREQSGHFDIVVEGKTPGADPAAAADQVLPWADAGATWWIEADWDMPSTPLAEPVTEKLRQRIREGPPGSSR